MDDLGKVAAQLRSWTRAHDPHVRAAVELLIEDGYWLTRLDFRNAAMGCDATGQAWVIWRDAARFRTGPGASASSSELAVLDLAVAIGSDAYRLSRMDDGQAEVIVRAFAWALGMGGMLRD